MLQPFDSGVDGCQRRRTRCVHDEVGSVEIEDVRDTPGDDVAELSGHRVLGDVGEAVADPCVHLFEDRLAKTRIEPLKTRRGTQLLGVLGKIRTERGEIVHVPGHGVADDDGGAIGVQRPIRISEVEERLTRRHDRPLLRAVHGVGDFRWYREPPFERRPVEVLHPSADGRVGLVGGLRVGVEVQRRIPSTRVDFGDRVAARSHVLPEGRYIRGVRQDRAQSDHCDCS